MYIEYLFLRRGGECSIEFDRKARSQYGNSKEYRQEECAR